MPSQYFLGIGINYIGTSSQLYGCINDVINSEKFFNNKFPNLQSSFLTDTTVKKPTRDVILAEIQMLLVKSKPFDTIILHYSGHGTSVTDTNGDEEDKKDECIVPIDLKVITDDTLNQILFNYLKPNVFLFCLFDSCFSGTVLDLKYTYLSSTIPIKINNNKPQPKGKVIMISGSRDDQTSADAYINHNYTGALTWAFLNSYPTSTSWTNLLENIRGMLKNKYTQIPLLSYNNGNINDRLL
jgi:hypothetical protein